MGAIFVSYRRGDSEGQARALAQTLAHHVGKTSVFMDVDGIQPGRDFRQVLNERLASCDMMLVIIGKGWPSATDSAGKRRLDDPRDFVRQEVAAALKRNIPVTPVLVQGASMPSADELPEDLQDLTYRNSFELSHNRWESDVNEMIRRLGLFKSSRRYWLGGGVASVILLMAALLFLRQLGTPRTASEQPPPQGTTSMRPTPATHQTTAAAATPRTMSGIQGATYRVAPDLFEKPVTVDSAQSCSDLCSATDLCESILFRPHDRTCWLKSEAGRTYGDPEYLSAIKQPSR